VLETDTLQITPEILSLIARIDEFKGAWRALGTLAPDRLLALRRVATIESIGSSTRIEGSRLSDREVEKLLSNLEIKSFATRDEQEVAGYAELMELVFSSWQDILFTENHIKRLSAERGFTGLSSPPHHPGAKAADGEGASLLPAPAREERVLRSEPANHGTVEALQVADEGLGIFIHLDGGVDAVSAP
jgi:hypothetical protein